MLGIHQEIQNKVLEEITLLFDTKDEEVSQEKLNKMPYIDMVIKETMRLFPILAFTARTATSDVQLRKIQVQIICDQIDNYFLISR